MNQLTSQQIENDQRWEAVSDNDLPGRYSMGFQGKGIFSLRDDEVPETAGHTSVIKRDGYAVLSFPGQPRAAMAIAGVDCESMRQVLSAVDGKTCFAYMRTNLCHKG